MRCIYRCAVSMLLTAGVLCLGATTASAAGLSLAEYTQWRDALGPDISESDLAGATAAAVMVPANGFAALGPSVSATGVPNGSGFDWTVFVTLDPGLFSTTVLGNGGSVATALALEVDLGTLVPGSVSLDPGFVDALIGDTFPGLDPYVGAEVFGTQEHPNETSVLATGDVDAIFAPIGSTFFMTAGPHAALTFSTTSDGDLLTLGGIVFQAGSEYTIPTATFNAVPEPSGVVLGLLAAAGGALMLRRRS